MMTFFQKHKLNFIRATVVIFILGTFLGFGAYFFTPGSPTDTIVSVDGVKIPLHKVLSHYQRALNQVQPGVVLDDAGRNQKRDEVIRDLVTTVAYNKEAKKYGIVVPDLQVRNSLVQIPAFQQNGQFSLEAYGRALAYQLKVSPQEFEEEQRSSIAFFKLRWLIQSTLRVSDDELALALAVRGPAFIKAFEFAEDEKSKKKIRRTPAEMREMARQRLLEEKTLFVFNQWLTQVGSQLSVKTYLDRMKGVIN